MRDWVLLLAAFLAIAWSIHRARSQSITLDEANSYFAWVAVDSPAHWEPHSNNHVLNSALMRLSVRVLGLSEFAVRLPALLGGALYVMAMYWLCTRWAANAVVRRAWFVCLVYNPFVMDYLVAARGYGLALGFLGLSMYLLSEIVDGDLLGGGDSCGGRCGFRPAPA